MSDIDTPHLAGDALARAAFDAATSSHAALNSNQRNSNKAALFGALASSGISHVVVSFDGYGDEGQIENVEARAGDDPVELPEATITVLSAEWGRPDPVSRDLTVAGLIERLAYEYLGDTHAGWQDGDGAYGEFVFDVVAGTITLDHNERFTSSEHYSHEF